MWQEVKLSEIGNFSKGAGITKDELTVDGVGAVRYGELYTKHNFQIKKIYSRIPNFIISTTRKIKYGDILFAGSGETIDEIGKSATYLLSEECYAGGDVIIFSPKKADSLFLSYFLNVGEGRKKLRELGQGQSVVHIYKRDIENIKLRLPLLPEQKRIVAVLETWDQAIEKLGRKIGIKKNIKKGLMQNLLTGKIRLAGFKDEWQTVRLGTTGFVRTSSIDKLSFQGEKEVSLLNYMDVYRRDHVWQNDKFQKVTAKDQQIISSNLKKGDILFTPSSETPDDIGHSAVVMEDLKGVVFSYHLIRFRPKKNILSTEFSAYCFKTQKFYLEFWKKAQGATRYTLSKDAIESSKITIPQSKEEQQLIANILNVSDNEIKALEKKLSILKSQKKYLLNNLITGQIRTMIC